MSNTTLTNIPSTLETRVKGPSDGAQVPPSGPGSSDRFIQFFFSQGIQNIRKSQEKLEKMTKVRKF